MTNEEIKRGYMICNDPNLSCKDCPYNDNYIKCSETLRADARELIVEQEKEIEQLKDDYAKLQELFAQYQIASDKEIRAQIKQAKIDVLYELKEKRTTVFIDIDEVDEAVFIDDIDELLKEYKK